MSDPTLIPPSLEDVRAFFASLGSQTVAENFCDFYEERGWKAGREKMKNWQAAARRWHRSGWGQVKPKALAPHELTEWERKQKLDRLRDLRERKRAITHPGGSAFSVSIDANKLAVVYALEEKITALKKELDE